MNGYVVAGMVATVWTFACWYLLWMLAMHVINAFRD